MERTGGLGGEVRVGGEGARCIGRFRRLRAVIYGGIDCAGARSGLNISFGTVEQCVQLAPDTYFILHLKQSLQVELPSPSPLFTIEPNLTRTRTRTRPPTPSHSHSQHAPSSAYLTSLSINHSCVSTIHKNERSKTPLMLHLHPPPDRPPHHLPPP